MPKYKATGKIRHNHKRYKPGDIVELGADEKKSDLFVLVDGQKPAEKPAKKAEKAPEVITKATEPPKADAPVK